jgi:transposase
MAGVYKLEIEESELELKQRLIVEKVASNKEKVQLLYLLKSQQAKTATAAAKMIGRNRVTIQKWMNKYRSGGIKQLLEKKENNSGRPRALMGRTSINKKIIRLKK